MNLNKIFCATYYGSKIVDGNECNKTLLQFNNVTDLWGNPSVKYLCFNKSDTLRVIPFIIGHKYWIKAKDDIIHEGNATLWHILEIGDFNTGKKYTYSFKEHDYISAFSKTSREELCIELENDESKIKYTPPISSQIICEKNMKKDKISIIYQYEGTSVWIKEGDYEYCILDLSQVFDGIIPLENEKIKKEFEIGKINYKTVFNKELNRIEIHKAIKKIK
jgi:hypothetical protein